MTYELRTFFGVFWKLRLNELLKSLITINVYTIPKLRLPIMKIIDRV